MKQVQAALGHASAAVTLDLYGHLFPGDEDTTRAAFDKAWKLSTLRTEQRPHVV